MEALGVRTDSEEEEREQRDGMTAKFPAQRSRSGCLLCRFHFAMC